MRATRLTASCAMLTAGLLLTSCRGNEAANSGSGHSPEFAAASQDTPSFGTVLVDFSASFAPLTQVDRLALNESAGALTDVTVKDWSPPVTIMWNRIGANSTASRPLCGPFEFNRRLVSRSGDLSGDPEKLRHDLKQCVETVVKLSRLPKRELEQYTDLAGAISTASENWASVQGTKGLVILSDFLGDYKKGTRVAEMRLHGERIVMLHRIGNMDEPDVTTYLARITGFRNELLRSGAKTVVLLPTFRATKDTIRQALNDEATSPGVTISILDDLHISEKDGSINNLVDTLADSIAKRALEWPPPVVLTWFAAGVDGLHTDCSLPPVEFTPHLVKRTDADSAASTSSPDGFRTGIKEVGNLALRRANGNGDLIGALKLISEGETNLSSFRVTVILSDLSRTPPDLDASAIHLNRDHVIIIYRPSASFDSATFQDHLRAWQSYLQRAGSPRVCAMNLATITPSNMQLCLTDERGKQ
jgi:hypothetical protein